MKKTVFVCDQCGTEAEKPERWILTRSLCEFYYFKNGRIEDFCFIKPELHFCSADCFKVYISNKLDEAIKPCD